MPWGEWLISAPPDFVAPESAVFQRDHYRVLNTAHDGTLDTASYDEVWNTVSGGGGTNSGFAGWQQLPDYSLYARAQWRIDGSVTFDGLTPTSENYRAQIDQAVATFDFTGVLDPSYWDKYPSELDNYVLGVDYIEIPAAHRSEPGVVSEYVQYDVSQSSYYPAGRGILRALEANTAAYQPLGYIDQSGGTDTGTTRAVSLRLAIPAERYDPLQFKPGDPAYAEPPWYGPAAGAEVTKLEKAAGGTTTTGAIDGAWPINDQLVNQIVSFVFVHTEQALTTPRYPTIDPSGIARSYGGIYLEPRAHVQQPRWRFWRPGGGWTVGAVGVR